MPPNKETSQAIVIPLPSFSIKCIRLKIADTVATANPIVCQNHIASCQFDGHDLVSEEMCVVGWSVGEGGGGAPS